MAEEIDKMEEFLSFKILWLWSWGWIGSYVAHHSSTSTYTFIWTASFCGRTDIWRETDFTRL